jgi:CxxC motif-containing protein (DUF1111 family)
VKQILALLLICTATLLAQTDPGPRSGTPGGGGPFPTLNANELNFFTQALARFQEVNSVSGTIEPGNGLGPAYNGNSCAMCHAEPAIGGAGPGLASPQNTVANPQVAIATLDGATNVVPSFITVAGPVREARFKRNPDGTPDGSVHELYTITGRTDAVGCTLAQPDFPTAIATKNIIFRIPTTLFGLGLVENTPDATLRFNLASTQAARAALGIGGTFNTSGNDATITRFGWKAQNKSLLMFAGEAYNVEQGVTNELFPNEKNDIPGCVFNNTPEDSSNILNGNPASLNFGTPVGTVSEMEADFENFAAFMRLSAPTSNGPSTSSTQDGVTQFKAIGCVLCHSSTLVSGDSIFTGMSQVTYHPWSDFALHHMGAELADGITQGQAGPDQFRTAPLWGVGQRLFFMHDGRTSDLLQAINDHSDCSPKGSALHCGKSEADQVIQNFNLLTPVQVQDILNFLRSL